VDSRNWQIEVVLQPVPVNLAIGKVSPTALCDHESYHYHFQNLTSSQSAAPKLNVHGT
jgi:hypothetical protein